VPREFLPNLAKSPFRHVSSMSCAFATLQLRQGFQQIVSTERAELHQVLRGLTRAGQRTSQARGRGPWQILAHAAQTNAAACPQLAKSGLYMVGAI
jgi:hypothetical protein